MDREGKSFEDIGKSENLSRRRVMQIIDLAFLAPASSSRLWPVISRRAMSTHSSLSDSGKG
jgi:hypothetical protein